MLKNTWGGDNLEVNNEIYIKCIWGDEYEQEDTVIMKTYEKLNLVVVEK